MSIFDDKPVATFFEDKPISSFVQSHFGNAVDVKLNEIDHAVHDVAHAVAPVVHAAQPLGAALLKVLIGEMFFNRLSLLVNQRIGKSTTRHFCIQYSNV